MLRHHNFYSPITPHSPSPRRGRHREWGGGRVILLIPPPRPAPPPPPGRGAVRRAPACGSPPGRRPRPGAAVRQTMGAGSPAPAPGLRRRLLTEQGQSHRGGGGGSGGAGPGGDGGGWPGGAGLALARQLSHQRRGAPANTSWAPGCQGDPRHRRPLPLAAAGWGGRSPRRRGGEGRRGPGEGRTGTRGNGKELPTPAPRPPLRAHAAARRLGEPSCAATRPAFLPPQPAGRFPWQRGRPAARRGTKGSGGSS